MRLRDIALNNIKRRKAKVSFLLAGLMAGVATVVALVTITVTLNRDIEEKLDRFGANIVITPKTEGLSLNYGGIKLGAGGLAKDIGAYIKHIISVQISHRPYG